MDIFIVQMIIRSLTETAKFETHELNCFIKKCKVGMNFKRT